MKQQQIYPVLGYKYDEKFGGKPCVAWKIQGIGVASYGTLGHLSRRLPTIFSSLLRSPQSLLANSLWSGSLFFIALKTFEIGNERRSVMLMPWFYVK